MTCLIVGGGIAGFQAALSCRANWPDKAVTIIDAEEEAGYYRTLLPQFISGAIAEEKLFFRREKEDPLLTVRTGLRVSSLDRDKRTVGLSNGDQVSYERLILACGGEALLPGILAGPPASGIFTLRDLATARKIRVWLKNRRRVVVFGGSLVGVKTAVHLRQAGFEVIMVVRRDHILLRALSPAAAEMIEEHLRAMGIKLCLNAPLEDLRSEAGAVNAIRAGGQWIPCDTLLVAAGVTPDVSFLKDTGLLTGGELLVSPTMQTADKHIFAAGDGAVIAFGQNKFSPNTWPQASSQGRLAGENLYRESPLSQRDKTAVNALDLHGLSLVVLGPPVAGAETLRYASPREKVRREIFLAGGRPVGGALIGDISAAGALRAIINAGNPIDPQDLEFLRPGRKNVFQLPQQGGRRQALIMSSKRSSL